MDQSSQKIRKLARHLMSELSLIGNWLAREIERKKRIKKENKSVHIGLHWIGITGFKF